MEPVDVSIQYIMTYFYGAGFVSVCTVVVRRSPPLLPPIPPKIERETNTLNYSVMTLAVIFCKWFLLRQTSCLVRNIWRNLTGFLFMGSF